MSASSDAVANGLIEAALDISRRRREILRQLKNALEANDIEKIKRHASELCGISYEESDRTNPSVH